MELVNVCVLFDYQNEHWSRKFQITKGSQIMNLKQSMVKPTSPPEDGLAFDLLKQRLRVSNLDTIDHDETFEFRYLGPSEGKRLFDKDRVALEREEDARKQQEEQRKQEEEERLERERQYERRKAEEAEMEKRRQEVLAKAREEEERKRKEKEAEEEEQGLPSRASVEPAPVQKKSAPEEKKSAPVVKIPEWQWTMKGVQAVAEKAAIFGHPRPGGVFTEGHLNLVKVDHPFISYQGLQEWGCIQFRSVTPSPPTAKSAPAPAATAKPVLPGLPAPRAPTRSIVVTSRESGEQLKLDLPQSQTIFDLKKVICNKVSRGPQSKLTLKLRTGKLLGDATEVDKLTQEERENLIAYGIDVGPPVPVEVTIFYAEKGAEGTKMTVEVNDTATFLDLRKAVAEKRGGKFTELKLVTKNPSGSGYTNCVDSAKISNVREVGATGKLMKALCEEENGGWKKEVVVPKRQTRVVPEKIPEKSATRTGVRDPDKPLAEEITIQLDASMPDISVTLQAPVGGASVRWIKEQLCKQDPTGKAKPSKFHLSAVDKATLELDNKTLITTDMGTLLVMPHEEPAAKVDGVEVEVTHAMTGNFIKVVVPIDAKILDVRQAVMKAAGLKKLSEVKIVSIVSEEDLAPAPDDEALDGRIEFQMVGSDLPIS